MTKEEKSAKAFSREVRPLTCKEENAALKRTISGIRGQMGLQSKQIKDLNKCISELRDKCEGKEKTISGLENQVNKLQEVIKQKVSENEFINNVCNEHKDAIMLYNQKPWYKKLFCFSIDV